LPYVKCWTRSGVIRATEELSWQGGHMLFVYLFARDANSLCVWVCRRWAQSSIFVIYVRSLSCGLVSTSARYVR